jgi:hypothetical protein
MAVTDNSTMRRLLALVVVLVAWTSLGGCYVGPDPVQYAALAVIDGRPTAVVAVCGRPTVSVDIYLNDNNTMDQDLHEWSVTVTVPNAARDVEVELLGAARPGWEITSEEKTIGSSPYGFKVIPLMSIEPGHRYTLDSSNGGPEGSRAPAVTFTTEDLPKIGTGQVLRPTDHQHSKVVPRDLFISERCS